MRGLITASSRNIWGRLAWVTVPFFVFASATPCFAQVSTKPTWAVVDFSVRSRKGKLPDQSWGKVAAQDITDELEKTDDYDVLPTETVGRTASSLNLVQPIDSDVSLLRLGQELLASSIVSGEVINYRVVAIPGSKALRGDVIIRVVVNDVGSGLPVNGAAVAASSSNQEGDDVTPDVVLSEAISQAASEIVSELRRYNLPTATVLNTYNEAGHDSALINQGTRSGFRTGMEVVILRGREQVALGRISDVEPDDATVNLVESERGIQPGDRIRAVFLVPDIQSDFPASGSPKIVQPRFHSNNAGFIQLMLVLGLVAFLFSNGRGNNNNLVSNVQVQAAYFAAAQGTPTDQSSSGLQPGVLITYRPDQFLTISSSTFVQAQAYRLDPTVTTGPVPVAVHASTDATAVSDSMADLGQTVNGFLLGLGQPSGSVCPAEPGAVTEGPAPLTPFTAYQYEVEIVYQVPQIDLPSPGGGTGNCFFVTHKALSGGVATPMGQIPAPTNPNSNSPVNYQSEIQFQFPSILANTTNSFVADYIVEVSTSPNFPKGSTVVYPSTPIQSTETNQISTPPVTLQNLLPAAVNASSFFYRYGVRNDLDSPGPYPDLLGERFLFSPTTQVAISQSQTTNKQKGNVALPKKKR